MRFDLPNIRHLRVCSAVARERSVSAAAWVEDVDADPVVIVDKESDIPGALAKVKGYAATSAFMQSPWVATTDMMIERLQACKAAGADYFIVKMPNAAYNHEEVLRFNEEVIPALS